MIYWAQFFHFYQPATQLPSVLDKICDESYRPLLQVLREFPEVRVTVNINAILTEMLKHCGHHDIIQGLKELGQKGQIELVGSAKYHPILPLIPPDEGKRQIELNYKSNSFFFGDTYKPDGFFLPEMAYNRDIAPTVVGMGHRWIILGGVACPADWPVDKVYQVEHDGHMLAAFFRDDLLSNKISFQQVGPKEFLEHLNTLKGDKEDIYVVTAMDAETYGHHIKDWEALFLSEVYDEIQVRSETFAHIQQKTILAERQTSLIKDEETSRQVKTVTISQILEHFPSGEVIDRFGWEALRWDFFYNVHDIHRIVFMIPIIYAAYCFKIKGAIITSILAFATFLPRATLLSPYPDPISRMVLFTVFALVLGILVGALRNHIERLQHLVVTSGK